MLQIMGKKLNTKDKKSVGKLYILTKQERLTQTKGIFSKVTKKTTANKETCTA